jgi:hypothetical protein
VKIGTCRADAEEVVCYHPEECVDYACRVWYEAGTDTMFQEQRVTKGNKPSEDRHTTTRLSFMDDGSGRLLVVQDCSRDDGSKKGATYRYEKASQKYQPTIVF